MYDLRNEITKLAEKALYEFVRFRFRDMGIADSWKNGLRDFVEREYQNHPANYDKIYTFLQNHDEQDIVLEELDITALITLIHFYWKSQGIYDVAPKTKQFFINHVQGIRNLRNTFDHYPQELTEDDSEKIYFDYLYFTECISSFAILVMKCKTPTDEWKLIYHKAKNIESKLHGERWLAMDSIPEHVLSEKDNMSNLLSLAEQGHIEAQVKVGKAYYHGDRVKRDLEKAYIWIHKAAIRGNPEAEYYLGLCYEYGYGVEYNREIELQWFKKSAEHGYAPAQYKFGVQNWGKINKTESEKKDLYYWIKLSAEQDYPEAVHALSLCNSIGIGVPKNPTEAQRLFIKSANLGYGPACIELGDKAAKQGDFAEAMQWYTYAYEKGDSILQLQVQGKIKSIRRKQLIEKKKSTSYKSPYSTD